MRKITGNKLFVKALKEEGVDILFGYPGACTIDISDELYKQDYTKVILPRHEQALVPCGGCLCKIYRKGRCLSCDKRSRGDESCYRNCDSQL